GEVVWLEPYPDALLEGAIKIPLGPEARYQQTEAMSLAFVTALQVLPARQRAVLILREVLGYHANEVADMLDSTVESVNSALKRARATLRRRLPPKGDREPPPAAAPPAEHALVAKFVRAWESGNVDALVALLTADVSVAMPPIPLEYHGRDVVARFCASLVPPFAPASVAADTTTSCRHGRMVSPRSGPTFAPPPAGSATEPVSSS